MKANTNLMGRCCKIYWKYAFKTFLSNNQNHEFCRNDEDINVFVKWDMIAGNEDEVNKIVNYYKFKVDLKMKIKLCKIFFDL